MSEDDEYMKALEIQRRNFEAQFGSIESMGLEDKSKVSKTTRDDIDESDEVNSGTEDSENSDSSGSVDSDSDIDEESSDEIFTESVPSKPKVVKLTDNYATPNKNKPTRQDKKLLKSGRAPSLREIEQKQDHLLKLAKKQAAKAGKEDGENLENDLQLQRLLEESHILSNTLEYSGAELTMQTLDYEDPTGKARKRILDSRIRKLAATNSSTNGLPKTLEKMPMSMRKGMIKSREHKIAKYEQEARDAGIVLSKVRKGELRNLNAGKGSTAASDRLGVGKKVNARVRDRGLKIHGVGRSTRNGLVISKDDIARINAGPKRKRR